MILKRIFPAAPCQWFVSLLALSLFAGTTHAQTARTYSISALDISQVEQGWGEPQANKSVEGHTLSIGGQAFKMCIRDSTKTVRIAEICRKFQSFFPKTKRAA